MGDWIEHNGGPQPVADDVWVEVNRLGHLKRHCFQAGWITWGDRPDFRFRYRILNQHLIDAARKEGIRLGLEAANKAVEALVGAGDLHIEEESALEEASIAIRALNPETIAREAALEQLTREAQEQGVKYDKEADPHD